jgi:outer membrane cobalamin receptor
MKRRAYLSALILLSCSLAMAGEEITLHVVDPQDRVVPGAVVEVQSLSTTGRIFSGVTNNQGAVSVRAALPFEVRVTAPGFDPLHQRVETSPRDGVRLQVIPAAIHTTLDVVVHTTPVPEATIEQTALEIDRGGARTVFDAVDKLVASAYVTRRGIMGFGLGQSGSITLRGLGGSPTTELVVVVDGRPDFMGLMGHPLPDFYTLSDVGSVSITEGPASVLYGSNAMGGAIEVKRLRPLEGVHTDLTASLGSYFTGQYRLTQGARFERGSYNLTAGIEHTNGERENSAFRNQDATLALGYDISHSWRTSLEGRYGHFYVEDPGTIQSPLQGNWSRVGRGGFSWNLDNSTSRTWGMARVFSSFGHNMIWDGFRSVDNAVGLRVHQNVLLASRLTVDGGTDLIRYGGSARNITSAYDYGAFHINDAAGFSRARYEVTEKLQLNAGIRYDHDSQSGGITVPEFGATWGFAQKYSFSAAVARGFRNPTIRELYLFPAPTPGLKPEHLWNYQATFQARPTPKLLAWVTGYYADIDNLIVTTGRWPNLSLANTGHAINKGLEVNGRWQVLRRVSLNSGYAFLHSTNLAPYSPRNKLVYSLDVDAGRAFVFLGGTTVGRTWADASHTAQVASYTVLNVKCIVPVGRRLSVFGMLDNLFNRHYEVLSGYPMPGINAAGGLNLRF